MTGASQDARTYYGASAGLALAARLTGRERLARRCSLTAVGAAAVSPPLLIEDLGRPERFHHMLRVFKVTSPMSVGTWILSAFGAAASMAVASEVTGWSRLAGRAAEGVAAALGMPLATYTSALLANTAIPVWHEARRELPFVFAGSSAATAGALGSLLAPGAQGAPARRLAIGGAVAEVSSCEVMQRRLGEAGRPYHEGGAGRFLRAGLVLAGGLLQRLGIWKAGRESARQSVR